MGTITDTNGNFSISDLKTSGAIVISGIGFITREILFKNQPNMGQVTLEEYIGILDETVVIAYGTTSRRLQTGNVNTIKAVDIEKSPVSNPLLSIQGRVPGIFIEQATGLPGGGVKVSIQGRNSLKNGNDPFYVIDGVPYTSQLLSNLANILGNSATVGSETNFGNPLSFINPSDIESIEILKDADATAIYGSRAANGAILITTKKGTVGQTKIDVNLQSGIGQVARKVKLLSTQQYLEVRKEAYTNDGLAIPNSSTPQDESNYDLTLWDQTRNKDWQKELIGNTAHYTDAQLSISGGSPNIQFLVGGGYHRETSVFPGDLADQKGSLHFNLTNTSTNQRFRFSVSGSYLTDVNHLISSDLTEAAMTLAPNAPELLNNDGSLNWAPDQNGSSSLGFINPLAYLSNKYNNKTNNLISNSTLSYEIIKGLNIRANLGYTNMQSDEIKAQSINSYPPEFRQFITGSSMFGHNKLQSWIIEPQISYSTKLIIGQLNALLGSTIQRNNSNRNLLEVTGYNSDLVLENPNAGTAFTVPENSTIAAVYKYNAIFGRINYNIEDKYIFNLTGRRDGSSRFGSENRFHNFGAVGIAWIFSNENLVKNNLSFLSFGKLRGSYGTTGNDQIGDYSYTSLFNPVNPGVPYRGGASLSILNLANPLLQWEETKKLSVGLDLGFLKDRVLLNINYFRNRSSNQLLPYTLPIATGFSSITSNFPATIQNDGWELSLSTVNFKGNAFSWSSNLNLTIPNNKLISFPDLATSSYSTTYILGQPITTTKVYNFAGVDPATGIYQYLDKSGKFTNDPGPGLDNRTLFVNTAQKFYGGFQNSFGYKGLQLDVLFQFVKQHGPSYYFGNTPGVMINQPVTILDRWQKPGDVTSIQRYNVDNTISISQSYASQSNAGWSDASYIRLKNLSLSWEFPDKLKKKLSIQNLRIYVQGQNLLTITNYNGLDPETRSSMTLPPLRVITFGFQLTL
jgi:TonB-linked SusC/RagA family outer membrane protein